ncbi:arginine kinase [Salpingoeca rosetta]|uniref:Arginine kinase n=1 Tax=Salpingoeca rosetta (strain ATCC 50818 / BSB-021) TaxID=946362 RepID=F2UNN6_SALR5|nr:arginine kinase [Salpingoeca rosetta]EGD79241.1 arginine kinase [Salpingoeca rosetta]|eukprot:XP_004989326.1 arginine kinase [Salpingoeca rosetta]
MMMLGRVAGRAAVRSVRHARLMSSTTQASGSSVGMKAATAVAIGSAVALFASEGLGSTKVASIKKQEESASPAAAAVTAAAAAATTPANNSNSDTAALAADTGVADVEPTYDQLNIKEVDGHIVLEWNQNGVPFRHVFDQEGTTVAGPGPVSGTSAKAEAVHVVETPAASGATNAGDNKTEPDTTTTTTKAAPAATSEELVASISRSLDNIERAINTNLSQASTMDGFPRFSDSCKSLLKKHLSPDVYLACAGRVTPNGFTFDAAIQSGVDNQDSGVGLYAGDEESYTVFAPLFDKVIEDYHNGYKPWDTHVSDMDSSKLQGNPDPEGDFVLSTRIRVGRNIRGLGLSPGVSRAQRREVERIVVDALAKMDADLKGKYFSLSNMSEEDRKQLVADHFLFKKGDRFLQSAGANRDWPESRGIFHNDEKTFLVWVNEEDQMRIISMQKGSDAKQIFDRLSRGIDAIEQQVKAAGYEFAHNDHLGYIHSCPTNCGTGMRASVHVKLPNVGKHPNFKQWCEKLRLQPRGIHGEHSESEGGVYDISNKERLGKSEVQLVQTMIDGVKTLIAAEKALAEDKPLPSDLQ